MAHGSRFDSAEIIHRLQCRMFYITDKLNSQEIELDGIDLGNRSWADLLICNIDTAYPCPPHSVDSVTIKNYRIGA